MEAAARALRERGIDELPVIGLAKRLEEVWLPGRVDPIILPRTSEGLYLLQRMRDEAHRAAITFQRKRSRRRARGSALEEIPGLGPARIKSLLARFGSVARMRQSSVEEIAQVPGIGPKTAAVIMAAIAAPPDEMLEPGPEEGQ